MTSSLDISFPHWSAIDHSERRISTAHAWNLKSPLLCWALLLETMLCRSMNDHADRVLASGIARPEGCNGPNRQSPKIAWAWMRRTIMANTILAARHQQTLRAVPAWRSSPGGDPGVRFEAQRPAVPLAKEPRSFADEKLEALMILRRHPDHWVRPNSDARVLACLVLALEGVAVAIEDKDGLRFRYSQSVQLLA